MPETSRLQVRKNDAEHAWKDVGNKSGDESVPVSVSSLPLPSGGATSAKQLPDNHQVTVSNIANTPVITGFATSAAQATQTTLLQGIAGFTVTGYDYIALTYVAAGNGVGEIETAIFKIGGNLGTTIATLTLTYNSNNEISSVTKI